MYHFIEFLIVWTAVCVLSALIDANIIEKKGIFAGGHLGRFFYRTIFAFLNTFVFYGGLFVPNEKIVLWKWIFLMIFQGAVFWPVFEFFLYLFLGWPLNHVGDSAPTDRIFQRFKHPFRVQFTTKIIFLLGSSMALIIIF